MLYDKQHSRRLTDYLENYWNKKRGKRAFPSPEDINVQDFDEKFRKDCFVVEFIPTMTQYLIKLVYLGDNLNSEYLEVDSGVHVKNLIVRFLEKPMDNYKVVIESKKPLYKSVEIPGGNGDIIKYRQILLPLGPSDDKPIKAVLGGMSFKKGD